MKVEVSFNPFPDREYQYGVSYNETLVKLFMTEEEAVAYAKELKTRTFPEGWRREID